MHKWLRKHVFRSHQRAARRDETEDGCRGRQEAPAEPQAEAAADAAGGHDPREERPREREDLREHRRREAERDEQQPGRPSPGGVVRQGGVAEDAVACGGGARPRRVRDGVKGRRDDRLALEHLGRDGEHEHADDEAERVELPQTATVPARKRRFF
jgi:hypothetical protein